MQNNYTIVVFAVIDTNVIISSMLGDKPSYTKDIMDLIDKGNIITLYDDRMLNEYQTILTRFFSNNIVNDKMKTLIEHGYLVKDVEETKQIFRDRDDIPFFEVKESAKELAPYLVTKNTKDFPPQSTELPEVVIKIMRYLDSFIIRDKESYLADIKKLLDNLNKGKYIKGTDSGCVEKYTLVEE